MSERDEVGKLVQEAWSRLHEFTREIQLVADSLSASKALSEREVQIVQMVLFAALGKLHLEAHDRESSSSN